MGKSITVGTVSSIILGSEEKINELKNLAWRGFVQDENLSEFVKLVLSSAVSEEQKCYHIVRGNLLVWNTMLPTNNKDGFIFGIVDIKEEVIKDFLPESSMLLENLPKQCCFFNSKTPIASIVYCSDVPIEGKDTILGDMNRTCVSGYDGEKIILMVCVSRSTCSGYYFNQTRNTYVSIGEIDMGTAACYARLLGNKLYVVKKYAPVQKKSEKKLNPPLNDWARQTPRTVYVSPSKEGWVVPSKVRICPEDVRYVRQILNGERIHLSAFGHEYHKKTGESFKAKYGGTRCIDWKYFGYRHQFSEDPSGNFLVPV